MNINAGSLARTSSGVAALLIGASLMAIGGADRKFSFVNSLLVQINWAFLAGLLLVVAGGVLLQRWGPDDA